MSQASESTPLLRTLAERLAGPMFVASALYLLLVATMIVTLVDVRRLSDPPLHLATEDLATEDLATREQPSGSAEEPESEADEQEGMSAEETAAKNRQLVFERRAQDVGFGCFFVLIALWPLFPLEIVIQYALRTRTERFWRSRYQTLFVMLCPPLRLCWRNLDRDGKVWLPGAGWREVTEDLRLELERAFSIPMVIIALMILPVLLIENFMTGVMTTHLWLRVLLHVGTGVIWLAFAVEFIVMVSVARKKLVYCKEHWLDLAIIVLPLLSFLRSLRIVRAMRLAKFAKLKQLQSMSRLYRLRGLAMRGFRALLLLDVLNRMLFVTPEKKLRALRLELEEKELEITQLQKVIDELEQQIAETRKEEGEAATG